MIKKRILICLPLKLVIKEKKKLCDYRKDTAECEPN